MLRIGICLSGLLLAGCSTDSMLIHSQNLAQLDAELMVLDLKNNNIENARFHLHQAEAIAPNDVQVLAAAGYFDEKMGDVSAAAQNYADALKIAPTDPQVENEYGAFLYLRGEYTQALPYFIQAGQNPINSIAGEALENAGLAEMKLGYPQQAQQYFAQASVENPR